MNSFTKQLKEQPDLYFLNPTSEEEVKNAEEELGLRFAKDYKQYLLEFGLASADGHEFTGFAKSPRLNVIQATKALRGENINIPSDLYLVEDLQIDSILIWQSSSGDIYQTVRNGNPEKIAGSLAEYFENRG